MFGKKCSKCNKNVSKGYDFCPFCGNNFNSENESEDYGMLGKNDFFGNEDPLLGVRGSFVDKLFNKALKELPNMVKMMEKEMNSEINKLHREDPSSLNIQFFVNGEKVFPNKVNKQRIEKEKPVNVMKEVSEEQIQRLTKLPKKEPKSSVRRLAGKMVYEIDVPGVTDIGDVFVNQLENTIEVKAIAKKAVYSKTLNINLPVLRYGLNNDVLVLELQAR